MRALATGTAAGLFSLSICAVAVTACGPAPHASHPISHGESADAGASRDAAPSSSNAGDAPRDAASTAEDEGAAEPTLGESPRTAIEVCLPRGQVAFLARLRCAGGEAVAYERVGLAGYRNRRADEADYRLSTEQVRTRRALAAGERDLHPVDVYTVTCPGSAARRLFFDMYHCAADAPAAQAPVGYTLAPAVAPAAPAAPKK